MCAHGSRKSRTGYSTGHAGNAESHLPNWLTCFRFRNLSTNGLKTINKRHFRNTRRLRTLSLGHNQLSCLSDGSLNRLKRLEQLELNDNKLSLFADKFFDNLQSLAHLKIENNPLYCDCTINYLIKFLKARRAEKEIAPFTKCSGGRANQGKHIDWQSVFI